jgi:hypothetical protein
MKFYHTALILLILLSSIGWLTAQNYAGSSVCQGCHNNVNPNLNYNIWEEYSKTGHPFKLNGVSGAAPTYPANTSPGLPNTPNGTTWSDFAYVIGGYGWKARWVKTDGRVFTANDSAQYNLDDGSWVAYHLGEDRPYNYGCFKCHTTGAVETGSWNGVPLDSLGEWSEPGVRCEGCHGPGGDHAGDPFNISPPIQGDSLKFDNCGECHQRGGKTNAIPASGGYIRHHEQYNEMKASKHADGVGPDLTCASCHDLHIPGRYPLAAGSGLSAIKTECSTCHPNHEITITDGSGTRVKNIDCEDCHMPNASKSAIGMPKGNGWEGDVATHIWAINTDAVPRDSMFEGGFVKLDGDGLAKVTMDFTCLQCHQNQDLSWAALFADGIHTNGIVGIEDPVIAGLPTQYELLDNYPNPFNPSTTIEFNLPRASEIRLTIYNMVGQEIAVLMENFMPAGNYKVKFKAEELPSGMYIYRLETAQKSFAGKMLLMK